MRIKCRAMLKRTHHYLKGKNGKVEKLFTSSRNNMITDFRHDIYVKNNFLNELKPIKIFGLPT